MDNNASVLQSGSSVGSFGGFRDLKPINEANTSPQRLKWIWEQTQTCDYAFDDFTRGNEDYFLAAFLNPMVEFFEIGDSGLATVQNIEKGNMCDLHYLLWDREQGLDQSKKPAVELLDYLFFKREVHRVNGKIPSYNKIATRFALAVGMKYEGEIREGILWKGKYYSINMYGLLKTEYNIRRAKLL